MKLINSAGEYMPKSESLTLDELFEEANRLGRLETGGAFSGRHAAEIKVEGLGDDYATVRSKSHDLKGNIAKVIEKAAKLKEFYRVNNY